MEPLHNPVLTLNGAADNSRRNRENILPRLPWMLGELGRVYVKDVWLAVGGATDLGKRAFRIWRLAPSITIHRERPYTISLRYFPHSNSLIQLIVSPARS